MQIERAFMGITTLGPGSRFAIWVNGCTRKCCGCVSERLQAFNPLNEMEVLSFLYGFDLSSVSGVTISGGEPFEQYKDLYTAVKYFNKLGIKDILLYTGYTFEQLKQRNIFEINYILENIAVLIDGPYIIEQDSGCGNLKGSDNQRVIFIRPEFKPLYKSYYKQTRTMQEFRIGNYALAVGIPDKDYIINFKSKTGEI